MRVIVDHKRVMCEYKKPEKRERERRISDIGAILSQTHFEESILNIINN